MIERFAQKRPLQGSKRSDPFVLASARASLPCGCSGFLGMRTDKAEPVTVLRACSQRHERIIEIVHSAMVDAAKSKIPLTVELVDGLLTEAEKVTS